MSDAPITEEEERTVLLGSLVVAPGTTYGDNAINVIVGNNSAYELKVDLYKIVPPKPPATCKAWFGLDYDDGMHVTTDCELVESHRGFHRSRTEDKPIWWVEDGPDEPL